MIKKSVEKALNDQVKAEFDSAYVYLAMSAYCESMNLGGFATWLRLQYEEEMSHAMRLLDFVHNRGGKVTLQAIAKPSATFGNLEGAYLEKADLEGANLEKASLTGAINLTQAQLNQACVDEETILPEGLTRPKPCPEEDLPQKGTL